MGINHKANGFYKYQPLNHAHYYGGDDDMFAYASAS